MAGSTKVGAHCMFGGQVGMAGHITIGDNVMVAAQSGIKDEVKSGSRLFGSPAVDFREYARNQVNISRIPDLVAKVKRIERILDNEKIK